MSIDFQKIICYNNVIKCYKLMTRNGGFYEHFKAGEAKKLY